MVQLFLRPTATSPVLLPQEDWFPREISDLCTRLEDRVLQYHPAHAWPFSLSSPASVDGEIDVADANNGVRLYVPVGCQ